MKGQYSLDFLVVMAGVTAFFLVIATASLDIGKTTTNMLKIRDSVLSAKIAVDNINSLCLLGDGTRTNLKLYFPEKTRIIPLGKKIRIFTGNKTVDFEARCQPIFSFNSLKGPVSLELEKNFGKVFVNIRK